MDVNVNRDEAAVLSNWGVIFWWERRRILYNGVLLLVGLLSTLIMFGLAGATAPPGEDLIDPPVIWAGALAYGFMANVCYTGGWMMELVLRRTDRSGARNLARVAFRWGLVFSCVLTTVPIWFGLFVRLVHR